MADFSRVATRRSSDWGVRRRGGKRPCWIPRLLAVAAFALVGCNANQTLNASGQTELERDLSRLQSLQSQLPYAQTSGFYGGR